MITKAIHELLRIMLNTKVDTYEQLSSQVAHGIREINVALSRGAVSEKMDK